MKLEITNIVKNGPTKFTPDAPIFYWVEMRALTSEENCPSLGLSIDVDHRANITIEEIETEAHKKAKAFLEEFIQTM